MDFWFLIFHYIGDTRWMSMERHDITWMCTDLFYMHGVVDGHGEDIWMPFPFFDDSIFFIFFARLPLNRRGLHKDLWQPAHTDHSLMPHTSVSTVFYRLPVQWPWPWPWRRPVKETSLAQIYLWHELHCNLHGKKGKKVQESDEILIALAFSNSLHLIGTWYHIVGRIHSCSTRRRSKIDWIEGRVHV